MAKKEKTEEKQVVSTRVQRLHVIMTDLSRINSNDSTLAVLRKYFVRESTNHDLEMLTALRSLSDDVKKDMVLNLPGKTDLFIDCFNAIDYVFHPRLLASTWDVVRKKFDGEFLARMEILASLLDKVVVEEELEEEELAEMLIMIVELEAALNMSKLPNELKLVLMKEFLRIRHAIELYKINGAAGIKEALQSTLGAVYANGNELDESNDPDVLERLSKLLDKADTITARVLKLKKILTKPLSYLIEKVTRPDVDESASTNSAAEESSDTED